jgi:hypothetical protein
MYLKIANGQPEPYSVDQLRMDNPSTSFPREPSDAILATFDVFPYTRPEQPDIDWMTSTLINGQFEQDSAGNWVQPFIVEPLSTEDASRNVRGQRDFLLSQTDWMALSDTGLTPAWATYRQELRDITSQPGFPMSVVWPTKP